MNDSSFLFDDERRGQSVAASITLQHDGLPRSTKGRMSPRTPTSLTTITVVEADDDNVIKNRAVDHQQRDVTTRRNEHRAAIHVENLVTIETIDQVTSKLRRRCQTTTTSKMAVTKTSDDVDNISIHNVSGPQNASASSCEEGPNERRRKTTVQQEQADQSIAATKTTPTRRQPGSVHSVRFQNAPPVIIGLVEDKMRLSLSSFWYRKDEFQQIKNKAVARAKQLRRNSTSSGGHASLLEGVFSTDGKTSPSVQLERIPSSPDIPSEHNESLKAPSTAVRPVPKEVQQQLNTWCHGGYTRRGLEEWSNLDHAKERKLRRELHVRKVLQCQEAIKRRMMLDDDNMQHGENRRNDLREEMKVMLAETSRCFSAEARVFASCMGHADANAALLDAMEFLIQQTDGAQKTTSSSSVLFQKNKKQISPPLSQDTSVSSSASSSTTSRRRRRRRPTRLATPPPPRLPSSSPKVLEDLLLLDTLQEEGDKAPSSSRIGREFHTNHSRSESRRKSFTSASA